MTDSPVLAAFDAAAVIDPLMWLKRWTPRAVPSRYAPYHRQLVELPDPGHSQMRAVYRGAAKTTITRGMVLHAAIHRRVRGILLIRATYADCRNDRDSLIRNAYLAGVPAVESGEQNMIVIGDVPVWTRTPGGAARGINWVNPSTGEVVRPELVVIDDLETRETARSATQTAKISTWLFADALQCGDPGGTFPLRVVMLGTPITPTCLIAQAMRGEKPFDLWDTPLIVPYETDGVPAWPDNHDPGLRARTPELAFATEYDMDPLPAGTLLFPPKRTIWSPLPASAAHEVVVGVDPAGDGADATVAVAACLTPRALHIVDCLHHTGSMDNAPAAIGMFVRRLHAAGWLIRGVTFEGVGAWQFMRRLVATEVAPVRVTSGVPSTSKVERLLPLTVWHKLGALTVDPALKGTAWDREFHTMTQDGQTITGHDDCPDATAWACAPLTNGWRIDPAR